MTRSRCAIVTGGNTGIGRAITLGLASDGFDVVCNYLTEAERADAVAMDAASQPGGRPVVTLQGDMTSPDDARRLAAEALRRFGAIDVLVNNAGGGELRSFLDMEIDDWERIVARNLTTTYVVTRAVAGTMVTQRSGRIINVSSQQAFKGAARHAHYCAAKAGVVGLTRALALEFAPYGILVNAVAPGPIETSGHAAAGVSGEQLARQISELPLARLGQPEEISASVLFLANSPSGDFYTGQTLHPNGGDVMP
jgi:3-oxoacyl-[acyl-carrier protein] reductase